MLRKEIIVPSVAIHEELRGAFASDKSRNGESIYIYIHTSMFDLP